MLLMVFYMKKRLTLYTVSSIQNDKDHDNSDISSVKTLFYYSVDKIFLDNISFVKAFIKALHHLSFEA